MVVEVRGEVGMVGRVWGGEGGVGRKEVGGLGEKVLGEVVGGFG